MEETTPTNCEDIDVNMGVNPSPEIVSDKGTKRKRSKTDEFIHIYSSTSDTLNNSINAIKEIDALSGIIFEEAFEATGVIGKCPFKAELLFGYDQGKKIKMARDRWFGEEEESFLHNVTKDKETAEVEATEVAVGIRAEAPKMLWADLVSIAYLIYRIPYILIGLRIPEEEWRGKDTSLTQLKVFGCDSFVKVKDVCGEAMKCTFIGSGSDKMRYSFQDTKSHQVIRSRDITFVDPIYGAKSATDSSSVTKTIQKSQSPGGSSDTSEGFENSGRFEYSGRSDEEYSEDGASSKEGGSEK
ncbi:hypothetical protein Tco_1108247 [Tanacetum coccineum]